MMKDKITTYLNVCSKMKSRYIAYEVLTIILRDSLYKKKPYIWTPDLGYCVNMLCIRDCNVKRKLVTH